MNEHILTKDIYRSAELAQASEWVVPAGKQVCIIDERANKNIVFHIQKQATLFYIDIQQDSSDGNRVQILLEGEQGSGNIFSLVLAKDEQHIRLEHQITHLAPYTESRIISRGAINDRAQVDYVSTIHVAHSANHAQARQSANMLVLDAKARVKAIPDLQIENNIVQCSHGVSISHLNDDVLFYLQSRGIDLAQARTLHVQGHIMQLLQADATLDLAKQDIIQASEQYI